MRRCEVDYNELSPMMKQYYDTKEQYQEELLFYRLGDFYELFFEDGEIASRELELTLTGKNAGLKERVPMCGVPFHSVKPYIEKLVSKGYKVAICEQLEDPKTTKGMVKRGVVQVISKGTVVDLELLNEHDNHYIASILDFSYLYTLCYADISTGDIFVCNLSHNEDVLVNTILKLGILEVVLKSQDNFSLISKLKGTFGIEVSISDKELDNEYESIYEKLEDEHFICAVKHLLYYLVVKELKDLSHLKGAVVEYLDDYLSMDVHTIRNLELVQTLRLKERTYSLLWLMDKTRTSMGSRKLKQWMLNPLKNEAIILDRQAKIETLNNEFILKDKLRDLLYKIYDIERLCGKISCGSLNARDLLQLKSSLAVLPEIKTICASLDFDYEINTHKSIYELLEKSIYEDPPVTLKDGYLIKEGYNQQLDELKKIRSGGKDFIAGIENDLKEKTGIKNLKVGYNKVFGYYIEISKGQIQNVPEDMHFERRQTLTGAERYISPELKEKEALVLNAEEKIVELEYQLFCEVKETVKKELLGLKDTASVIAELDALVSLAVCAEEYHFVKPEINHEHKIDIKGGRHPVIEKVSNQNYISNDCVMDSSINTLLITGPNMSGKSTYMRQLAIIIVLSQMGSYVPCTSASLPIIDKIFTRIGASDDLVSGESTFMVEMKEAKQALENATQDSLVLFDELGRGTATYDGMSLAEAILNYITKRVQCKTLFSTHYHELTDMEKTIPSIKNVHVSASLENDNLIFLHKVKNGPVDKSYGIHVAKLAGMPSEVIIEASEILSVYESGTKKEKKETQLQLYMNFEEEKSDPVIEELKKLEPLKMTPMEAINALYELKEKLNHK